MSPPASPPADGPGRGAEGVPRRRPGQLLECGWCGGQVKVARVGRTPKWCSDSCRHRAWEARRASVSGDTAVRVVDRTVEVERAVRVVEQVEVPTLPKGPGWVPTLEYTVHVRAIPAPGPVRCVFRSQFVQGGFFNEDGEVWDSTDRLVAQSRQLGLTPLA